MSRAELGERMLDLSSMHKTLADFKKQVEAFNQSIVSKTAPYTDELSALCLHRPVHETHINFSIASIKNSYAYLRQYAEIYAGSYYLLNSGLSDFKFDERTESIIKKLLAHDEKEIIRLYAQAISQLLKIRDFNDSLEVYFSNELLASSIIRNIGTAITNVLYLICGFDLAIILKSTTQLDNQFIKMEIINPNTESEEEFCDCDAEMFGLVKLTFKEPRYKEIIKDLIFKS